MEQNKKNYTVYKITLHHLHPDYFLVEKVVRKMRYMIRNIYVTFNHFTVCVWYNTESWLSFNNGSSTNRGRKMMMRIDDGIERQRQTT